MNISIAPTPFFYSVQGNEYSNFGSTVGSDFGSDSMSPDSSTMFTGELEDDPDFFDLKPPSGKSWNMFKIPGDPLADVTHKWKSKHRESMQAKLTGLMGYPVRISYTPHQWAADQGAFYVKLHRTVTIVMAFSLKHRTNVNAIVKNKSGKWTPFCLGVKAEWKKLADTLRACRNLPAKENDVDELRSQIRKGRAILRRCFKAHLQCWGMSGKVDECALKAIEESLKSGAGDESA